MRKLLANGCQMLVIHGNQVSASEAPSILIDVVKSSDRRSAATLCSSPCRVPRSFCASALAGKPFRLVSANGCLLSVSTVGSWLLWRRRRLPPSSCRRRRLRHQLSAGTPFRLAAGLPPWRGALARKRRWISRLLWHETGRRARPLTPGRLRMAARRTARRANRWRLAEGSTEPAIAGARRRLAERVMPARWRQRRWGRWRKRRWARWRRSRLRPQRRWAPVVTRGNGFRRHFRILFPRRSPQRPISAIWAFQPK